ncbi:MAG: YhdP family protein [Nitrosomonas sp.]|nr:YhdP family protein [Nitrosomonas sp.]
MQHFLVRLAGWCGVFAILLASTVLLGLRYWLLPSIGEFRNDIAAAISRTAEQMIRIDSIEANWDGLRPHLLMHGVRVFDAAQNLVLVFSEIEGTVSWRSVLRGEINFHEIIIDQPALTIRRDTQGGLHIAGVHLQGGENKGGFADWLLRQRRVIIKQAAIFWQDELRAAPVLYFDDVNFHLQNDRGGTRHRFGLKARVPVDLVVRIDVRGDFNGTSFKDWSTWQGRLFIDLHDFVLENWLQWLSLPDGYELAGGTGTCRAWLDIAQGIIGKWTADVALQRAAIRFAEHLPWLKLDNLQGRLGQVRATDFPEAGTLWFADYLEIGLKGAAPRAVSFAWQQFRENRQLPLQHRLRIDQFDLGLLGNLLVGLPLAEEWRNLVLKLSPRGEVSRMKLGWQDNQPRQLRFNLQGDFNDLSIQSYDGYPEIAGLSGAIEATESAGVVALDSRHLKITGGGSIKQKLLLDSLTGQIGWRVSSGQVPTLLALNKLAFSGKDAAGVVSGYYRPAEQVLNQIVLDGSLSRGDLALLHRQSAWLPDGVLRQSVSNLGMAGQLSNASFQVAGNVMDAGTGAQLIPADGIVIRAQTEIKEAHVKLPGDWPVISNLSGKLFLQRDNLSASFAKAKIANIDLQDVDVVLRDISAGVSAIRLKGKARGETEEIVDLVRESRFVQPVRALLSQTRIAGEGKLSLELDMPMNQADFSATRLEGRYQFFDNQIDLGRYVPDLNEINGELVFTGAGVVLENINGKIFGGPVKIASTTSPNGGLRIQADGEANFDVLALDSSATPESLLQLWGRFVKGTAAWTSTIDVEPDGTDVVVMSDLKGLALSLPAPLAKTAAENMPAYFRKQFTKPESDLMTVRFGEVVTAKFQRILEKPYHYQPIGTIIHFGEDNQLPVMTAGTTITGAVSRLEWDQWRELIRLHGQLEAASGQPGRGLDGFLNKSAHLNLHVDQLEYLGSYFNDSQLLIDRQGKAWSARVASKEITGEIDWLETAPHQVNARLSKLIIPARAQQASWLPVNRQQQLVDWPSVDLVADNFMIGDKVLGQLALRAAQKENGWHLEKLRVVYPDGEFNAKGVWRNYAPPFTFSGNLWLQTANIGDLLERHGQKNWVARGEGEVEGDLQWNGKPSSIDFPSLSGKLNITAKRGQLIKLKTGIGKLLGIFDLKSLPRRLMLDFNDLMGKGFGFDYLSGGINLDKGIAMLHNVLVTGSSANLVLAGEVDLVNETQSLNLKSFPSFGLATPVAGIASMIATLTLQNPFDRVLLSEYAITGSWDAPEVVKFGEEGAAVLGD